MLDLLKGLTVLAVMFGAVIAANMLTSLLS